MPAGFNWGLALKGVSGVLGLLGGKHGGGGLGLRGKALLSDLFSLYNNYDPIAESQSAVDHASSIAEQAMTRATSKVMGDFADEGSRGWLPDTARSSAVRGAVGDIGQQLAGYVANTRSHATEMKMGLGMQLFNMLNSQHKGGGGGFSPDAGGAAIEGIGGLLKNLLSHSGGGGFTPTGSDTSSGEGGMSMPSGENMDPATISKMLMMLFGSGGQGGPQVAY